MIFASEEHTEKQAFRVKVLMKRGRVDIMDLEDFLHSFSNGYAMVCSFILTDRARLGGYCYHNNLLLLSDAFVGENAD